MRAKVVVVDDHPVFREGLRSVVGGQPDLKIVAEAGDARACYAAVEATQPDLVLLDVKLPGADGMSIARELIRRNPAQLVLMCSGMVDEHVVTEALRAGAKGYVGKDQPPEQVLEAIRAVMQGQKYLPPSVSAEHVETRQRRGSEGPIGLLSAREREVFDLLVRGLTNEEIAQHLLISRRTVETHRSRILKKLRMHSAVELIRLAARYSLLVA